MRKMLWIIGCLALLVLLLYQAWNVELVDYH